jgi:hypothetical protein
MTDMTDMTIAADSGNESRNIFKRMRSKVSNAYDSVKNRTPDVEQVKDGIGDQTARAEDAYYQFRGRDYAQLAQLFKEWAPSREKDKLVAKELNEETGAFLAWLADSSEGDQKEFVRGLYSFFASLKLDLKWMLDPERVQYMESGLKETMGKILHIYCLAYWKSKRIQSDVEVLVKLQKWMDKPDAKENAEFNRQVLTKLVNEDLIPSPPIELFLATEEDRREYSVKAIKEFIKDDTQRFYELLKMPAVDPANEIIIIDEEQESAATDEAE